MKNFIWGVFLLVFSSSAFAQTPTINAPSSVAPGAQFTPTVSNWTPHPFFDFLKIVTLPQYGTGTLGFASIGQPLTAPSTTDIKNYGPAYKIYLVSGNVLVATADLLVTTNGSSGGSSGGSVQQCPAGQVVDAVNPFHCTPLIPGPKGDPGQQGIQGIPGVKGDKGDPGPATTMAYVSSMPKDPCVYPVESAIIWTVDSNNNLHPGMLLCRPDSKWSGPYPILPLQ